MMVEATGFFNFLAPKKEVDTQDGLFNFRSQDTISFLSKKDQRGQENKSSLLDFSSSSPTTNTSNQTTTNTQDNRALTTTDARNFQTNTSNVYSPTSVVTLNSPNANIDAKKTIDTAGRFTNIPDIAISPTLGGSQEPNQETGQSGSGLGVGSPQLLGIALIAGGGYVAYRAFKKRKKK